MNVVNGERSDVASTYVKVTSLEEAERYFEAGLLYWWSTLDEAWWSLGDIADAENPPRQREVDGGRWGILVEEEDVL